jgi:hypothetical protein
MLQLSTRCRPRFVAWVLCLLLCQQLASAQSVVVVHELRVIGKYWESITKSVIGGNVTQTVADALEADLAFRMSQVNVSFRNLWGVQFSVAQLQIDGEAGPMKLVATVRTAATVPTFLRLTAAQGVEELRQYVDTVFSITPNGPISLSFTQAEYARQAVLGQLISTTTAADTILFNELTLVSLAGSTVPLLSRGTFVCEDLCIVAIALGSFGFVLIVLTIILLGVFCCAPDPPAPRVRKNPTNPNEPLN